MENSHLVGNVRRGSESDLYALVPLIVEAYRRMAGLHGAETTLRVLPEFLAKPQALLWIAGDPPAGYCLAEQFLTGEMFVHQVYLRPGTDPGPLHRAIEDEARARECPSLLGVTFRHGGVRGFQKFGFQPIGVLMAKEM